MPDIEKGLKIIHELVVQPDFDDFSALYAPEQIARDREYVAKRERDFSQHSIEHGVAGSRALQEGRRKAAQLGEGIVALCVGHNNWLGDDANAVLASRYDDVAAGTDVIAYVGGKLDSLLAIDVAVGGGGENAAAKIVKNKEDIVKGKLTSLRYVAYDTPDGMGIRGAVRNAVRVVVAYDRQTLAELAGLLNKRQHRMLAEHPAAYLVREEIIEQLKTMSAFARANKQEGIAHAYEHFLGDIERIHAAAVERYTASGKNYDAMMNKAKEDVGYQDVVEALRRF